MHKGSLRGSIFALMSTAIGAGILSLPYVFKEVGIILGIIFLSIGAISTYYAIVFLSVESNKCKTNITRFS